MNKTIAAHIALFLAQVIYAVSFVIAKDVTAEYMPPFGLVVFRVAGAVILFWASGVLWIREKVAKKDILRFALLAVFGVAVNQLLFLKGLDLTSPISAAIMMITTPILVLIIAAVMIREKVTWIKAAGALIGFAGAALLMTNAANGGGKEDNLTGDILVMLNAMSWGMYLVLVKPFMQKYHTITILKWVFLFGLFFVVPFGWSDVAAADYSRIDNTAWTKILFIIIGTTYLAYLLNTYALKALSPAVAGAYIYLQPVMTAIIAIAAGKDNLTWIKVGSALIIFLGVYLVSGNAGKRKPGN